jgi:hypothetical protein
VGEEIVMSHRTVYAEDAITWLTENNVLPNSSLVASMPDISEFPKFSLLEWKTWFFETATLILSRTPEDGVTIFYQSDIKFNGEWVDKGYLCQKAADQLGHALLWHKIVCRTKPGQTTFGRPAYAHLLCFSKSLRLNDMMKSTPDVIPELGDKTWERGMGLTTSLTIAKFILENSNTKMIINPFCGEGSMLAAANAMGLLAIGIERSPKRADKSRNLTISPDHKNWMH